MPPPRVSVPPLTCSVSLSPDEVGGSPALEGLHLQGQRLACTGPSGTCRQAGPCIRRPFCGTASGAPLRHRVPCGDSERPRFFVTAAQGVLRVRAVLLLANRQMPLTRWPVSGVLGPCPPRRRVQFPGAGLAEGCLGASCLVPHTQAGTTRPSGAVGCELERAALGWGNG